MSDRHHQCKNFRVLDLVNDAAVADSVTPQSSQVGLEAFAETERIALAWNPVVEVGNNVALRLSSEFLQFLECPVIKIIDSAHASLSVLSKFLADFPSAGKPSKCPPSDPSARKLLHGHEMSWFVRFSWPGNQVGSRCRDVIRSQACN